MSAAPHHSVSNDPARRPARPRAARVSHAARQPRDRRRTVARARRHAALGRCAGAAAFWPIAAPDAFEDMLGYALWPREYGRQFWSHGPRDIMRAMTAPTAAFAAQADDEPSRGARLPGARELGQRRRHPIAPSASRG